MLGLGGDALADERHVGWKVVASAQRHDAGHGVGSDLLGPGDFTLGGPDGRCLAGKVLGLAGDARQARYKAARLTADPFPLRASATAGGVAAHPSGGRGVDETGGSSDHGDWDCDARSEASASSHALGAWNGI